ncbi:MAG: chromate transporter [Candidatus Cloacimonas sp.]|jgi:chromate transporter|nr:chromate transporter [Candidatus Cloacimonadota bacterium]
MFWKLLRLYLIFFKIGLFSYGGGYVMLPLIRHDVEAYDLFPIEEFNEIVAISQMTPGPIATNAATYTGYRGAGFLGSVVATTGVVSPSVLLLYIVITILRKYKNLHVVQTILDGVRPITVGMISSVALYFFEQTIFVGRVFSTDIYQMKVGFIDFKELLLFSLVLGALTKTKISPILVTLSAGVIGMIIF